MAVLWGMHQIILNHNYGRRLTCNVISWNTFALVILILLLQILLRFETPNSYFGSGYGQADSSQGHLTVHQPTGKIPWNE